MSAQGMSPQGLAGLCKEGEEFGNAWVPLDFEDLAKQMWRFRGGIRSRAKLPRCFSIHRQRLRGAGSSEVGALAMGSNLNWVGFLCHLSPFLAKVDAADPQLCCLLCSLLTPELCARPVCTWGTFWWVPLNWSLTPLPQLVHESPAKLFLALQLWDSSAELWKKKFCAGTDVAAAASMADGNWEERGSPSLCPRKFCA